MIQSPRHGNQLRSVTSGVMPPEEKAKPVKPKMTWAEMARQEGHRPKLPSSGQPPRSDLTPRVLAYIERNPGRTAKSIASSLDAEPSKVDERLCRLRVSGAVRYERSTGGAYRYWVAEGLPEGGAA